MLSWRLSDEKIKTKTVVIYGGKHGPDRYIQRALTKEISDVSIRKTYKCRVYLGVTGSIM